jgi:hypothetical protein
MIFLLSLTVQSFLALKSMPASRRWCLMKD